MKYLKLFTVLTLTFNSYTVFAGDKIAMLQFSNQDGWTQLVFQLNVENTSLCNKLNQNHWNGVKTYCQNCKKEFESCIENIPDAYLGIEKNKPIILPYLSSRQDRIVFFGMPIETAKSICTDMANSYKSKLNRDAKCIFP